MKHWDGWSWVAFGLFLLLAADLVLIYLWVTR